MAAVVALRPQPTPEIQTGNADIANSGQWAPTVVTPGTTPLPGHEHKTPWSQAAGRLSAAALGFFSLQSSLLASLHRTELSRGELMAMWGAA